jgi:hypothetical protein
MKIVKVPDKTGVNMVDLATAVRQTKNNTSPVYDELMADMIKTTGTIGTQWL